MSIDAFEHVSTMGDLSRDTCLEIRLLRIWLDRNIIRSTAGRPGRGRDIQFSFRDRLTALILANLRRAGLELSIVERCSAVLYGSDWKGRPILAIVAGDPQLMSREAFAAICAMPVPVSGIDIVGAATALRAKIEIEAAKAAIKSQSASEIAASN